jgi:hypothetical protein
MHELPQGLPFAQCLAFGSLAAGSDFTGSDFAGSVAIGAAAAFELVSSLWQTSFFEMQLLPHGLPFLQFLASDMLPKTKRQSARVAKSFVTFTNFESMVISSKMFKKDVLRGNSSRKRAETQVISQIYSANFAKTQLIFSVVFSSRQERLRQRPGELRTRLPEASFLFCVCR